MLSGKRILLILAGGIAAYKSLDLIRRLREQGAGVRCVLTRAGAEFVTPLSISALSADKVYTDLFSLTEESEMGHIRLSREADLVVVAPATANIIAKMAAGIADDLATAVLLATDTPVLIAPGMNVRMWHHEASRRNLKTLAKDGISVVGPATGALADGEFGEGRLAEIPDILAAIKTRLAASQAPGRLSGRAALVTSGPTREAIDPIRYMSNRSSGKQGHAIAAALARLGAATTLVAGPSELPDPVGVRTIAIQSAEDMLRACQQALPVDVAVCAAAVSDWRVDRIAEEKLKKGNGGAPNLRLIENPDILATLSRATNNRPLLVIGFAAETERLIEHARAKRETKGCDWILANDVSADGDAMGGDQNTVHFISETETDAWPTMSKAAVADALAGRIADYFAARGGAGE